MSYRTIYVAIFVDLPDLGYNCTRSRSTKSYYYCVVQVFHVCAARARSGRATPAAFSRMLPLLAPCSVQSATATSSHLRRRGGDEKRCRVFSTERLLNPDLNDDANFNEMLANVEMQHVPILSVLTADALRSSRTTSFNATAAVWGLPFVAVGSNNCLWPHNGFRWLARSYAAATAQLARRSPNQVAVIMDSQDAFVQGSAQEIRDALRASGKPLMLVLETGCARKRCTTPLPQPGEDANSTRLVGIPGLTHINGGVVVGEAAALEVMWGFVANNTYTGNRMSHQHSAQHGIGKFVNAHPELMAFDRTQALAAVMNAAPGGSGASAQTSGHEWSQFYDTELVSPPRTAAGLVARERVINRATGRAPCFIHVPGTQEYKRKWAYMNETMRAWDEISALLVPARLDGA